MNQENIRDIECETEFIFAEIYPEHRNTSPENQLTIISQSLFYSQCVSKLTVNYFINISISEKETRY